MTLKLITTATLINIFLSTNAFSYVKNTLHITMDPLEFQTELRQEDKHTFKPITAQINNNPATSATLNIRGQNCLKAPRKCFGLKFEDKQKFPGLGELESKSFNLVSMWHETGYISSKIGFEFFRATGLFDIRSEYAEVIINGESFGLYLVVEKPKKAIKRNQDGDVIVARRKFSGRLDISREDYSDHPRRDDFSQAYTDLAIKLDTESGATLLRSLEQGMDLDSYMNWLLVNSVLKNGDYTDELYVYADVSQPNIYFEVMPWDLDDLFKGPHWGNTLEQKDIIKNSLLYSLESALDQKIQSDPILYSKLEALADSLLSQIRSHEFEVVEQVIDLTRSSIDPYLDDEDVLNGSLLDGKRSPYTREYILDLIDSRREQIIDRVENLAGR